MNPDVEPLRIVFAGTPDFAVPILRALLRGPDAVVGVLTQPDRPAGRGRRPQSSPVKQLALDSGVPLTQPDALASPEDRAALAAWAPDLLVVAAYGLILPREVLSLPARGCVNVHASLLPAYRGAAPIARAILDGCGETGVTILEMAEGLDSGPVLLRRRRAIGPRETAGELHDSLAELGASALMEALHQLQEGTVEPEPQDPDRASYAPKIRKAEAELDWNRPSEFLDRAVRAFNPWPVAFTARGDHLLRVWGTSPGAVLEGAPGTVVSGPQGLPQVVCGDGRGLILEEVQPAGRSRMPADAALRGGYLQWGERLGAARGEEGDDPKG